MAASPDGFANLLRQMNRPTANMVGGAALGAGLSLAGNAMNGELEGEDAGRVALEALLAGAAGGALGHYGGNMVRNRAIKNQIDGQEVLYGKMNELKGKNGQVTSKFKEMGIAPYSKIPEGNIAHSNFEKYKQLIQDESNQGHYVNPTTNLGGSAALLGGMTAAAGLGGLLGGGLSNAVEAVGISGFGSSNTDMAKAGMGAGTTAQPLQAVSPEEQAYYDYLAMNQMMPA